MDDYRRTFNESLHHELSHGLGPGTIEVDGREKQVDRYYFNKGRPDGEATLPNGLTLQPGESVIIAGRACTAANDGARQCMRHGRAPPFETRWQPSSPRGPSTD